MSDEVKKLLRLLHKHEELIMHAYHQNGCELVENAESFSAIEELINARMAWRLEENDSVRMSNALIGLLDHGLRNSHRRHVDADIGGRIADIEGLVNNYKAAVAKLAERDVSSFWRSIEEQAYDLRETLKNTTRQLWRQIDSEFGNVDSLDMKVLENKRVLEQAKRLNDGLELVQFDELSELAGNDIKLRRLLIKMLAKSISDCQLELADALHRLKDMLFEFRKQQRHGRLIKTFYSHFQQNPLFLKSMTLPVTASIFNQVEPLSLRAHADLNDASQEQSFTHLISGLRKAQIKEENLEGHLRITADFEEEVIDMPINAIKKSVSEFMLKVVESDNPLSAMKHYALAPKDCSHELWLYAIITQLHSLPQIEKAMFEHRFHEDQHPDFDGNFYIKDIELGLSDA